MTNNGAEKRLWIKLLEKCRDNGTIIADIRFLKFLMRRYTCRKKSKIAMKENEFNKTIWENKEYLIKKCGYYPDEQFFQPKEVKSGTSNDFYISDEAIREWVDRISKRYTPYNNDRELFIKDLRERRSGQYSNGTLYSSSRLIAEMFKGEPNRKKLLKKLDLDNYNFDNFKWYLEYRLPISGCSHPAQLDLAIFNEQDKIFVGIESKMKEIYSKYHNDFSKSYEPKLKELGNDIFDFSEGTKDYPIRVTVKGCKEQEYCNFYYKQQICHLLGMKKFKEEKGMNRCMFLNFVFDISDIPEYKDEEHIKSYLQNEKIIMEKLSILFETNGIEYCGIKTQKDFLEG